MQLIKIKKNSSLRKILLKNEKASYTGEKYLQNTHLIKNLYPGHVKTSYNLLIRKQNLVLVKMEA